MTDELPIPQEAITAAMWAVRDKLRGAQPSEAKQYEARKLAEAAIRAFCEAMGMRVEETRETGKPLRRISSDWKEIA